MAGKHRGTRGLWLRGGQEQDEPELEVGAADVRPADVMKPPVSWNNSTMCIQTLRDALVADGWGQGDVQEIPISEEREEELPERPGDLGVGWWR
jgi:hypothetical protein